MDERLNSFWKSRKGKLSNFALSEEKTWISEYPEIVLLPIAALNNAKLIANKYDVQTKVFQEFDDLVHLYDKTISKEEAEIFDSYPSKLDQATNVSFTIVSNGKYYKSVKKYLASRFAHISLTILLLAIMGIFLGLASLYFGAAYYMKSMFFSYFKVDYLPLLNIFPAVLLILLLYFISNKVWFSFLITSVLTMLLTWVNYFKLLLRDDPLLAADLTLFHESVNMISKYNIKLSWKIISVFFACVLGTAVSAFILKGKIRSYKLRLAGTVVLVFIAIYSFSNIYMNNSVYTATENFDLINRWSATQVFISRGFIYPFIYSFKTSIVKPPARYDEKESEDRLFSYNYSDIPDKKKVNVISIMLEAYNDFSKFNQIKFNTNVYGYLSTLKSEGYHGELVTNIFAGGTTNTERSFITGFTSLSNYRSNVNSYARYFSEQGYTVEGSHPCYAWFYNRKNINEYLGFEKYYFFDNYYSALANGQIARDNILFPEIIKLYEANKITGKPYFSFNVTYQNHGPYSTKKLTDIQYVKNQGYPEGEYNILNNYFSGIYNTNQQLKALIDYFRKEKEPVVIILFGDHNPWLGDNNSVYKILGINFNMNTEEGFYNYYNTPYIIWGNNSAKEVLGNDFKGKGPNIGPYFLMNEFFKLAGYDGNEFMKLSNELKSSIDVVHATDVYKESGVLTEDLTPESIRKLTDFKQVQYYWSKHFRLYYPSDKHP